METWAIFTGTDLALAVIGLGGLLSVVVVISTAFRKVNQREFNIRQYARTQSDASDS